MSTELIKHPDHYNTGTMEVIEAIEGLGLDFTQGSVLKYVSRYRHKKEPLVDLAKAKWYVTRLAAFYKLEHNLELTDEEKEVMKIPVNQVNKSETMNSGSSKDVTFVMKNIHMNILNGVTGSRRFRLPNSIDQLKEVMPLLDPTDVAIVTTKHKKNSRFIHIMALNSKRKPCDVFFPEICIIGTAAKEKS